MIEQCSLCCGRATAHWKGFVKCRSCGLVLRSPMPTEQELAKFYNAGWHEPDTNKKQTGGTDLDLARIYVRKLARSLGAVDFKGQHVLEFGAGTGAVLSALSEQGARVSAVEPFGYEHLRDKQFEVVRYVDELPKDSLYDGIITIDVVEHLAAPWETVAKLRGFLKPGGWILIATPNADGLNARISRSNWRETTNAGHLMFFNPATLRLLLQRAGYRDYRRLNWRMVSPGGALRRVRNHLLQSTGLDGELRVLAHNGT